MSVVTSEDGYSSAYADQIEAEQALLGLMMFDNSSIPIVQATLQPTHFGEPLHQRIYSAMLMCVRLKRQADPFTLKRYFIGDEALNDVGGPVYLVNLMKFGSVGDVDTLVRTIIDEAKRRELVQIGEDLIGETLLNQTAEEMQERALSRVLDVQRIETARTSVKIGDIESLVDRAWAAKMEDRLPGIATGFEHVDAVLGGLHVGDQFLVGGRTGMGKSAVVGSMARNMATAGTRVHIISAEMTRDQLMRRLITDQVREAGFSIPYRNLRSGKIEEWERDELAKAEAIIKALPITIDDRRDPNLEQIYASCRQAGAPIVIVDHIQIIDGGKKFNGNKYQEVTHCSKRLKAMWGELGASGIVCSQVNRQTEAKGLSDRRPSMGDLRESGALEQDADIIGLLFREEYYLLAKKPPINSPQRVEWNDEYDRCKSKLEINIAKNREGEPGIVFLHCDMATSAIRRWNGYA